MLTGHLTTLSQIRLISITIRSKYGNKRSRSNFLFKKNHNYLTNLPCKLNFGHKKSFIMCWKMNKLLDWPEIHELAVYLVIPYAFATFIRSLMCISIPKRCSFFFIYRNIERRSPMLLMAEKSPFIFCLMNLSTFA